MFIDIVVPGDRNVIKKEVEKILKYKDLTIDIQRMWNVKAKVIPVKIGVTGTISKSLRATYQESMKFWALHTYYRRY